MFETTLKSKRGDSRIIAGTGLLARAGDTIAANCANVRRVFIAADENAAKLHLPTLQASFDAAKIHHSSCIIPAGEESKSLTGLSRLWEEFNKAGITRSDLIVAFGGGVTGDLTGFAAATWLRGVPIVQIPTTLLAMVDSSIGGKTAIDLPSGKNLAGAFHQPDLVLIDPALLSTLPANRFAEGMAEVIKYGCIMDAQLFAQLETLGNELQSAATIPSANSSNSTLESIICRCAQIKAEVVSRDEFDTGERMLLNFGHTFGHALEKVLGYGAISHGEAVAIGMVAAAKTGEKLSLTPAGTAKQIASLLKLFSLPTTIEEFKTAHALNDYSNACECTQDHASMANALTEAMMADKKNMSGNIHLILLNKIGSATTVPTAVAKLRETFAWQ